VHPAFVLCPSCIPAKVGINQKAYSYQKEGVIVTNTDSHGALIQKLESANWEVV